MRKWCTKIAIFAVVFVGLCLSIVLLSATGIGRNICGWIFHAEDFNSDAEDEITGTYDRIVSSPKTYTKLIVGDSVCRQLFNPYQDENTVYIAEGANISVSLTGQYILICQYIDTHPDATDVFLIVRTLQSGIGNYTYNVVPFTARHSMELLDYETIQAMNEYYGRVHMNKAVIWLTYRSPLVKKLNLNTLPSKHGDVDETQICLDYLKKIYDVCKDREVTFHLLHSPLPRSDKNSVKTERRNVESYIKDTDEIAELVEAYYTHIGYYPDSYFKDGVHFDEEHKNGDWTRVCIDDICPDGALKDFITQ